MEPEQVFVVASASRMFDVGKYLLLSANLSMDAARLASSVTDPTDLDLIARVTQVITSSAAIYSGSFAKLNEIANYLVLNYDPKINWAVGASNYNTSYLHSQAKMGSSFMETVCYGDICKLKKDLQAVESSLVALA
jgi:hypothetical protein